MPDPYDISQAPPASPRGGAARPVLWVLLVICAAGNMVTTTTGINVVVGAVFGVATIACAATLIVQHYRNRRR